MDCDANMRTLNNSGGPTDPGCNDGNKANIGRPRSPSRPNLRQNRPRRDRGLAGAPVRAGKILPDDQVISGVPNERAIFLANAGYSPILIRFKTWPGIIEPGVIGEYA